MRYGGETHGERLGKTHSPGDVIAAGACEVAVQTVGETVEEAVEDGSTSKRRVSVRPDSNTNTRSYDPVGSDPVYSTPSAMRGGAMYAPVRDESETETTRSVVAASTTDSPTETASGGAGASKRHGEGATHEADTEVGSGGERRSGEVRNTPQSAATVANTTSPASSAEA